MDYEQQWLFEGHYDHKKTQEKAQEFLLRTYPRALRVAGTSLVGYQSPQWSAMPKGTPSGNREEDRRLKRAAALEIVRATESTIERCDRWARVILKTVYLDHLSDDVCISRLGYGRTQYFTELKPSSLEQFAEAFPLWNLIVH